MPIPIQLQPPPALERSLVPYVVTNFNRIRDAFLHASTSVSFITGVQIGPWPLTINIDVPYQANILLWTECTFWNTVVGFSGHYLKWDGVTLGIFMDYYFNEIGSHKPASAINTVTKVAAGSHSLELRPLSPNELSDANDRWRWCAVFIEAL